MPEECREEKGRDKEKLAREGGGGAGRGGDGVGGGWGGEGGGGGGGGSQMEANVFVLLGQGVDLRVREGIGGEFVAPDDLWFRLEGCGLWIEAREGGRVNG